jgi:hypothetical protein
MDRSFVTGGVRALGRNRIQFDFRIERVRHRPSQPWIPHETHLGRAPARALKSARIGRRAPPDRNDKPAGTLRGHP